MQDLAGSYLPGAKIGATLFDRAWALKALKNSLASSAAKARAGEPTYSAAAAEAGFYQGQRQRLRLSRAGVNLEPEYTQGYHGVPCAWGARVVLSPAYSLTLADTASKIIDCHLGQDTSLVIDGKDVHLRDVRLEGQSALVIRACPGARVRVEGLHLDQPGYTVQELGGDEVNDPRVPAALRIRGYRLVEDGPVVYMFDEPGDYFIGPDGVPGPAPAGRGN